MQGGISLSIAYHIFSMKVHQSKIHNYGNKSLEVNVDMKARMVVNGTINHFSLKMHNKKNSILSNYFTFKQPFRMISIEKWIEAI